jgi:tripartite-type tricarboxylate transporter receptor subunit TctC
LKLPLPVHDVRLWEGIAMKRVALIVAASVAFAAQAFSQTYPSRPVKMIVAFSPGGSSDIGLRIIQQKLIDNGWPSIIVENRPGGGGVVAAEAVKQAAPDGYTLLQADASAFAINVTLLPDLPYDPLKDFTPIMMMWNFPSVLVVPASSPAKTAAELIALAKSKPGGLNYASQGFGSGGHLLGTMFQNALGVAMTHVPYKGAGQAMPDVAAGRMDYIFSSFGSVKQYVEGNTVRPLLVTSKKRLPDLPDVPTTAELGLPSVFLDIWFGLAGPANMPADVVKVIHDRVEKVMHAPDTVKRLAELGLYVETNTPEEFREMIRADITRLGKVIKDANIKRE